MHSRVSETRCFFLALWAVRVQALGLSEVVPSSFCTDPLFPCFPVHTVSVGRPPGSGGHTPSPRRPPTLFRWAARGRLLRLTLCGRAPGSRLRGQLRQVVCLLSRGWGPPSPECVPGRQQPASIPAAPHAEGPVPWTRRLQLMSKLASRRVRERAALGSHCSSPPPLHCDPVLHSCPWLPSRGPAGV